MGINQTDPTSARGLAGRRASAGSAVQMMAIWVGDGNLGCSASLVSLLMDYFPPTGGGGATASEILSIVPLRRAKNTSVEPSANQRPAPSSGPAHKPIISARPRTSAATGTILK